MDEKMEEWRAKNECRQIESETGSNLVEENRQILINTRWKAENGDKNAATLWCKLRMEEAQFRIRLKFLLNLIGMRAAWENDYTSSKYDIITHEYTLAECWEEEKTA